MSNSLLVLVILAAVAVFLLFRLNDVIGKKTGHENPSDWFGEKPDRPGGPEPSGEENVVRFPGKEARPHADIAAVTALESPTGETLIAAKDLEPDFNAQYFMDGARQAYEMILMAFENGDKETLRNFLDDDVYQSFESVIDDRKARELSVDARFVGLSAADIEEARLDRAARMLEIDIRFEAEMITAVRDASGAVVEGDPKEVHKTRDLWTFARVMGSQDPNWKLTATGE